jgi:hypothetical protein
MTRDELQTARNCYAAIRELIVRHRGGPDEAMLARLKALCRAAIAAVDDIEARMPLLAVEEYAASLFSAAPSPFVKLHMLRELEWFLARLFVIEAARDAPSRDRNLNA